MRDLDKSDTPSVFQVFICESRRYVVESRVTSSKLIPQGLVRRATNSIEAAFDDAGGVRYAISHLVARLRQILYPCFVP